jgi:hypothetical protein
MGRWEDGKMGILKVEKLWGREAGKLGSWEAGKVARQASGTNRAIVV